MKKDITIAIIAISCLFTNCNKVGKDEHIYIYVYNDSEYTIASSDNFGSSADTLLRCLQAGYEIPPKSMNETYAGRYTSY